MNPLIPDDCAELKRVAQAFRPVNRPKHKLESLCHTSGGVSGFVSACAGGVGEMRFRRGSRRGFSLLEILVAVSVLGMLVVFLSQATTSTLSAWSRGQRTLVRSDAGRPLEDRFGADLEQITFYGGLPRFPDDPDQTTRSALGFYIASQGVLPASSGNATVRDLSWVEYRFEADEGRLYRDQTGYKLEPSNNNERPPFGTTARPTPTPNPDLSPPIEGVLAFCTTFVDEDGVRSVKYVKGGGSAKPSRMVRVAFVQVSAEVARAIEDRGAMDRVVSNLELTDLELTDSEMKDDGTTPAAIWKDRIEQLAINGILPPDVAQALRPVQATYLLPED